MLPMRPMKLGGEYLIFGENAIEYLGQLEADKKRAFLVLDGNLLEELGYLEEIQTILEEAGFAIESFNEVEPDPSFKTVQKGAEKMLEFEPDWIIAIGGGSIMDAAKAMWILYEHPEIEDISGIKSPIPKLRNKAKMVNIPTTSGTGSEVSRSVVITDTEQQVKVGIGDMEMMPDIAILEPKYTKSLPKGMTAATGMDALTHAIEARVSRRANILGDMLADGAIKLIFDSILTAYNEPHNLKAREDMLVASMISGISFTNVSLGIVHSIAHAIGGKFGVPHGVANAVILPYVIDFNSQDERAQRIYDQVATDLDRGQSLTDLILDYNKKLEIPDNLQDLIMNDEKFENLLDELVELAIADGCTKTNPIIPNTEEFKALIRECYYGRNAK